MNFKYLIAVALISFTSCQEVKKEDIAVVETSRVEHLPYYDDESFTPNWLEPGSEEERNFHSISDFRLVNQLGETIT